MTRPQLQPPLRRQIDTAGQLLTQHRAVSLLLEAHVEHTINMAVIVVVEAALPEMMTDMVAAIVHPAGKASEEVMGTEGVMRHVATGSTETDHVETAKEDEATDRHRPTVAQMRRTIGGAETHRLRLHLVTSLLLTDRARTDPAATVPLVASRIVVIALHVDSRIEVIVLTVVIAPHVDSRIVLTVLHVVLIDPREVDMGTVLRPPPSVQMAPRKDRSCNCNPALKQPQVPPIQ